MITGNAFEPVRSKARNGSKTEFVHRYDEHGDVALDRHFAANPEDRGANVVIFKFCDDEELADEG